MSRSLWMMVLVLVAAAEPKTYTDDFERTPLGKLPEDLMVFDGAFTVRQVDGNKCLELAPDPIGTFGVAFGPADSASVDVKARIWSQPTGKRFPEFGTGAGDAGGWKLWLVPGQDTLELHKSDETKASFPFKWRPGNWTWLRLRVRRADAKSWVIEGKAWPEDGKEPDEWLVAARDAESPPAGRGSVWGVPLSEQPIRFDDLSVANVADAGK